MNGIVWCHIGCRILLGFLEPRFGPVACFAVAEISHERNNRLACDPQSEESQNDPGQQFLSGVARSFGIGSVPVEEEMPYNVLWLLPADGSSSFHPPCGVVLTMQPS